MANLKKVSIWVPRIRCANVGSDPGNELEFYGELYARRMYVDDSGVFQELERKNLFFRDENHLVELSQGADWPNSDPVQELTLEPGEFLALSGLLIEHDTVGPNDPMNPVNGERKVSYNSLQGNGDKWIRFQESDQQLDAQYMYNVTAE